MDGDKAQQAADKTSHRSQTCQIISGESFNAQVESSRWLRTIERPQYNRQTQTIEFQSSVVLGISRCDDHGMLAIEFSAFKLVKVNPRNQTSGEICTTNISALTHTAFFVLADFCQKLRKVHSSDESNFQIHAKRPNGHPKSKFESRILNS